MNVLMREWLSQHYPERLLVMYEFEGWYVHHPEIDGDATILLDSEHGYPEHMSCHGSFTGMLHNGRGYSNDKTFFVYFSDSSLDSLYIEEWNSPFTESAFPGDWPNNGAQMALEILRENKKDDDFFQEGYITFRKGIDLGQAEPRYQFMSGDHMHFNTVGANTGRVNVPPIYDATIPHTPYPGIDPEPTPTPEPEPEPARPSKVPFDSFDFNGDGKVSFGEYWNIVGWKQ